MKLGGLKGYLDEEARVSVENHCSAVSKVNAVQLTNPTQAGLTVNEVPCLCSQRWILSYIGFFGFVVVYMLRVNFSVAIVCMVRSANKSLSVNETSLNNTTIKIVDSDCNANMDTNTDSSEGEFEWDKSTTSTMLSAYFYGYIVTQIPGGVLSDRFGGKRVLGSAAVISSICTLLLPVCARAKLELVYILRIVLGLAAGVSFPAMHSLWGRWAPPLERSKLMSVCYAGTMVGNIVTFPLSGYLCAEGFDNGWGSIFYVTGSVGLIWSVLWFILTSDLPKNHTRITREEIEYITTSIGNKKQEEKLSVPWKAMCMSPALWACLTSHACWNWTNYTLLTGLPTFFKEALKFDLKDNGLFAALPYICQTISAISLGQFADFLRSRKILSTTATRKIFQVIAFIGAASFLIGTGYITCERRFLAVLTLSLAVAFGGLCRVGYTINHVDFAPRYAGILFGITNTFATIPGMLAPLVAGELTPNKTAEEWQTVFFVCAGFAVFGAIIFGLFARGEEQDWARPRDIAKEYELAVETEDL